MQKAKNIMMFYQTSTRITMSNDNAASKELSLLAFQSREKIEKSPGPKSPKFNKILLVSAPLLLWILELVRFA